MRPAGAVAHGEQGQLGADHPLFDHDLSTGVTERLPGELRQHVGFGRGEVLGDQHALARGQPVGLDHVGRVEAAQVGDRGFRSAEGLVLGGRHAGVDQELLHVGLGPLEPGALGAGAEHESAGVAQPVGEPFHERCLGPDHVQVGLDLLHRLAADGDGTRTVETAGAGHRGVPRRDDHLRVARQHRRQRVLAATRTDDADLHAANPSRRCTNCSRPGPVPTIDTGTPIWSSRNAR